MRPSWIRSTLCIAFIYMFRMLGLFLLIPVFTLYANQLNGATPQLIGVALGAYGLSQGCLQIPFGLLSDRWGRKPLLLLGLFLFALGSLYGAYTHTMYGMIGARILQGMGAIGSVLMALLTDVTPDKHRTHAMAIIGVSIGLSISVAMILGPFIAAHYGLSGIFQITLALALLGIGLIVLGVPTPQQIPRLFTLQSFKATWKNPDLQRFNLGIFCQHLILTATFFSLPLLLKQAVNQHHITQTWHFYLALMIGAFTCMFPCITFAERTARTNTLFKLAIAITTLTQALLVWSDHLWAGFCGLLFIYFVVFNILEALLPSLISKHAPAHSRGTAMGIYSSSQFLGIFVGGALAGLLYPTYGHQGIFILNALTAGIWFIIARKMKPLPALSTT